MRALQKLARLAKIETTMRYVHPDAEDILEIASAVQQARAKTLTTVFTIVAQQETTESRKM
jgi:hypothetical protein